MKPYALFAAAITAATFSHSASALNIVLTNDDSYATNNIQTLFTALKAAGHSVVMSAPCTGQSGKGGSMNMLQAVNVVELADDQYCVGNHASVEQELAEATPVMAALYGLDVAAFNKWGAEPDLLISGPNEGNNIGYLTNNSGTLGATNVTIARNIPAIAVSDADHGSGQAELVADVVVELVAELVANRTEGQPLLPSFTGLNVNTPADLANNAGYAFSNVGWNAGGTVLGFTADMSQSDQLMGYIASGYGISVEQAKAMFAGKAGLATSATGSVPDTDGKSEGVLLEQGYITISTIDASIDASAAKKALSEVKLNGLLD